jgi:hypothetical protein
VADIPTIAPVARDELIAAYALAEAAAEGRDPEASIGGEGYFLTARDGEPTWHGLSDDPLNRAMLAIRRRFPKGMMHTLVLRITALGEMTACREAEGYISTDSHAAGQARMSRAMFAVAADMPLTAELSFDREPFFQHVARAYAEQPD